MAHHSGSSSTGTVSYGLRRGSSRDAALVAIFTSVAVTLRILKHLIAGTFQFFNPMLFSAYLACELGGVMPAAMVAFFSYVLSDAMIGVGPWTVATSTTAAVAAAIYYLLKKVFPSSDMYSLLLRAYLATFFYDVMSSVLTYIVLGQPLETALVLAILGLFIPVGGGYMIGIGPLTEFTTSLAFAMVMLSLRRYARCRETSL